MSSDATLGVETRARKRTREKRARDANAGEAFPRLPDHLVAAYILRSEHFDDPADLARLPAVIHAMRDAVAATGLLFDELDELDAVNRGCVSAVQRLPRGGRLSRRELLCQAAARSGQLEELKVLRADGWPWDRDTCSAAALGGHLEVLQWARANDCPWDEETCANAAHGGHLEVLQWAHANDCPYDEKELHIAAEIGHEAIVRALIEAGADVNKAINNDIGVTPLHVAAHNGHETVVRALIEAGADVNQTSNECATPLYVAAHEGNETVVRALIGLGADVNKAVNDGMTPLFIAAQNGHEAIFQILRDAGAA